MCGTLGKRGGNRCEILVGETEGRKPGGRSANRLEVNIGRVLKEIGMCHPDQGIQIEDI
jgi:hypothetical protein